MKHLPVHPTAVHPKTGKPLRALFIDRHGRPRFPILGASPDDPDDGKKADDPDDGKKADDPDDGKKADGPKEGEPGYFPPATPRASMTAEQQIAYDAFHGRKHENRAKEWASAFPGKTAAEIKAIVDAAEANRRNTLTLDEKTIEDAKNEARQSTLAEIGPKAVKSAFELLLPDDMSDTEKAELIDDLDLSKFLNSDNEVNTAKVRTHVARITPDKGQERQRRDFGAGPRGGAPAAGSVAAVMEARRAEREKRKSTTTS